MRLSSRRRASPFVLFRKRGEHPSVRRKKTHARRPSSVVVRTSRPVNLESKVLRFASSSGEKAACSWFPRKRAAGVFEHSARPGDAPNPAAKALVILFLSTRREAWLGRRRFSRDALERELLVRGNFERLGGLRSSRDKSCALRDSSAADRDVRSLLALARGVRGGLPLSLRNQDRRRQTPRGAQAGADPE